VAPPAATLRFPIIAAGAAMRSGIAGQPAARPRIQHMGTSTLLLLCIPQADTLQGPTGLVRFYEVALIFGERFLLTVHPVPVPHLARFTATEPAEDVVSRQGIGGLVHALTGEVIDASFSTLDFLMETAGAREDDLFAGGQKGRRAVEVLARVRRELFTMRRVAAAQRSAITLLARDADASPGPGDGEPVAFSDELDRAIHLEQALAVHYEVVTGARSAYRSWVTAEITRTSRTLLMAAYLLFIPGLVFAVYGMNFAHMPERSWPVGHLWAVALALLIVGTVWVTFRRWRWI
jgi:magnesium transporter